MTSQSYESQLTPDELQQLHAALTEPAPNMAKIQREAPPWRDGPSAGARPALRTIYKIASRLRSERILAEIESANEVFHAAQDGIQGEPAYAAASSYSMNQVFGLLCQEVIQKTVNREDTPHRIFLIRSLLRYQQLLLQKARFQRLAVEQFDKWYMNGPAKEILEKLDVASYADRIDQLGRAIFGEDWHPQVAQTDGIPGLDQLPPLPLEPEPDPVPLPAQPGPDPAPAEPEPHATEPTPLPTEPEPETISLPVESETDSPCLPDKPPTDQQSAHPDEQPITIET